MREQDRVISVMSEWGARGGRAPVETWNPCSNSIELKVEGELAAICVSQSVNHVCTLPTQDVFQYFFEYHLVLYTHLFHAKCLKCFFLFIHIGICRKLPNWNFFLKKYPAQTFWNCFIFKYSSASETFKYIISYTVIIHWPVTFKRKMRKCS